MITLCACEVEKYRGFMILYYPQCGSYGIKFSNFYLSTPEVAKRIIDTYLKRTGKPQ